MSESLKVLMADGHDGSILPERYRGKEMAGEIADKEFYSFIPLFVFPT